MTGFGFLESRLGAALRASTRPRGEAYVYLIGVDGFVKIGVTANVPRRIALLQGANPNKLELIAKLTCHSWYGARSLERTLHAKFEGVRVRGEWFRDVQEIRDEFMERAA